MYRTAILKNDSTAEKRIEEEAFALASIAHYCFVETNLNCGKLSHSLIVIQFNFGCFCFVFGLTPFDSGQGPSSSGLNQSGKSDYWSQKRKGNWH